MGKTKKPLVGFETVRRYIRRWSKRKGSDLSQDSHRLKITTGVLSSLTVHTDKNTCLTW